MGNKKSLTISARRATDERDQQQTLPLADELSSKPPIGWWARQQTPQLAGPVRWLCVMPFRLVCQRRPKHDSAAAAAAAAENPNQRPAPTAPPHHSAAVPGAGSAHPNAHAQGGRKTCNKYVTTHTLYVKSRQLTVLLGGQFQPRVSFKTVNSRSSPSCFFPHLIVLESFVL